jgi:hypothetical protein
MPPDVHILSSVVCDAFAIRLFDGLWQNGNAIIQRTEFSLFPPNDERQHLGHHCRRTSGCACLSHATQGSKILRMALGRAIYEDNIGTDSPTVAAAPFAKNDSETACL